MQTTVITTSDGRWTEALTTIHHDIYHLARYQDFAAEWQEPGTPYAFIAEHGVGRLFIPFIERPLPDDLALEAPGQSDAIAARGFPGPIEGSVDGALDGDFRGRAIEAFVDALRDRGVVSAYLVTHPFLSPLDGMAQAGPVIPATRAVSIDLSLSTEQLWQQTRANHRRSINKARRAGYRVRLDDDWSRFDEFVVLHGQTMERLAADPRWRHTREYFVALREALAGHIHLCLVELGDELVAGAILTEVDDVVLYLTSGTADAHRAASPMKLVVDYARSWAKERGNRILSLGGSPPGADDLIHWKLGFSPRVHEVFSWRIVSDRATYRALSERRLGRTSAEADIDPARGFFPGYRRPLTASSPS